MKLLALLFLVGLALTTATPVPSSELSLADEAELEYFLFSLEAEDDGIHTELGKRLKDHLDDILAKIKDAIDHGKIVKDETIEKMKEIREKLREMKEDIGTRAKGLLKKIKDLSKDYFGKILEDLGINTPDVEVFLAAEGDEDGPKTELGKKLQEHLDEILAKIKDAIEHGKTVKEETLEKMKQILENLREMKEGIGKKAKDLIEKIKEGGKNYIKQILDKLGLGKQDIEMQTDECFMEAEVDETTENLREKYNELLKKLDDAFEQAKAQGNVNFREALDDMREYRKKQREENEKHVGEKGNELMRGVRDRVKDYFKNLLERFGKQKRAISVGSLLKKLKEKVLPLFDPEKIKEKIEEVFGKGNEYAEMLINKLKGKNEKAKQWLLDYIEKFYEGQEDRRRSIKEIYERVKNYLKDLRIELKENFSKFGEWAVRQYEKGLEKSKNKSENIRKLAKEFIHDAKILSRDVIDQAKDFFQEYKDDLGTIYDDVIAKIKELNN